MCGIVGYIGGNNSVSILLKSLEKLEYRGYDSAGVSIYDEINKKLNIIKSKGRLSNLIGLIDNLNLNESNIGIGHTRWATHGEPSDLNSHPHLSNSGKIALVHNGIIENYAELKEFLKKNGKNFVSNTDSEIAVNLVDYFYANNDFLGSVLRAVNKLKGSFALGIICSDNPDRIIAVKKDCPMIIGIGESENYIASDIPAILPYTKKIHRLKEKEIAVIKKDSVKIYDFEGKKLEKDFVLIDWCAGSVEKDGYEHFMLKEIMQQPEVFEKTFLSRLNTENYKMNLDNITDLNEQFWKNLDKIYIIACGSAYNVGASAKYILEKLTRIPVEVDLASEFRYRNPILDKKKILVIAISQSGETADTIAAIKEARKHNIKVLSIVNTIGSSMENESDYVLYTWAGLEIAVATTKAYSAQLAVIYVISLYISDLLKTISSTSYRNYIEEILSIPACISKILEDKKSVFFIAKKYYKSKNAFFIGRNLDYSVCLEGSLKFKEISYIHSEACAAGELKHGTISLIENNTLVVTLATQENLIKKVISNIIEIKSRGASVLVITYKKYSCKFVDIADNIIFIPEVSDILMSSLSVIPLQLFAYYVSLLKNCDIDKPRNLAKSVTVE
ncbi:MAG: glutamine--fructose-6-phosphate aminotransferase [isomerizing] [Candidatus Paraimprobicoccus trichonymphae]|uniref:Glutamine--fructose-6-phosphate aminotransferase [isomerizing] n=1 Tax=Candidatus Paraimprobicoccus trichonymphae TaxID=3033793 RepID=A0AA48KW69_9FIRM|nr:MAG: glutamine--fructose-6-phosphate aminotransferase [isomerizing] [Candidatus Paraimprobicoccus trichonymphae]